MLNMNDSVKQNILLSKPKRNLKKFRQAISKKMKKLNRIVNFKSDRNQESSLKSLFKTNATLIDYRAEKIILGNEHEGEFSCTSMSRRFRNIEIDCNFEMSFKNFKFYRTSSRIKMNSTAIKSEFDYYANTKFDDFEGFYQPSDINRLFTSSETIPYSDIFLVTDSFREQSQQQQQQHHKKYHTMFISNVDIDHDSQTSTPMPERCGGQFMKSFMSCQEDLDNSTQINLDSPILYENTLETSSCSNLSDDLIILQG